MNKTMYLKGCSKDYSQKNPIHVKHRKQSTQTYMSDEGPKEITHDIVSEDGKAWYGIEGLEPYPTGGG